MADNNGILPQPGDPYWQDKQSPQKSAYKLLMETTFRTEDDSHLATLITGRLPRFFSPEGLASDHRLDIRGSLGLVADLGSPGISVRVLKTWLKGCVTSYRMTEQVMHNCLLGRQGHPDSLDHYYHCPHLYAPTSFLIPETDSDPLVRFGLVHPNKQQFKVISCMSSAYHAVKSMIRAAQFTPGVSNIDTACGSGILELFCSVVSG